MTYQETLNYLYDALPMFSRIGSAAYKTDLTNTIFLCEALNNPQQKFKSIHVAGTNGKGSVSHMLAAVLQTAGYKTGLYTSPHIKDFRERIKINGIMCSEDFIISFTEKVKPLIEKIQPSFFEITVAMAFTWFAEQHVEVAIIETGLGGRLDSTNVIHPEISVITNIGYDHMNLLGETLEKIAFEKAGIIKTNTPVIIGETLPETKRVFEKAALENNAPLFFASAESYVTDWQYDHHHINITVADKSKDEHNTYDLDLPGVYQTKNIVTVLSALYHLQLMKWRINKEDIYRGLSQTKKLTGLKGRWEVIKEKPTVVFDVCHNVDGVKQVADQLELSAFTNLYIIIGFVKDKEAEKMLSLFPAYANYYFTKPQTPRALPEEELTALASHVNLSGKTFSEVNEALKDVLQHALEDDLILICGSVFLIADVHLSLV